MRTQRLTCHDSAPSTVIIRHPSAATRAIHRRGIALATVLAVAATHPAALAVLVIYATAAGMGAGCGWLADLIYRHIPTRVLLAGAPAATLGVTAWAWMSTADWAHLAPTPVIAIDTPDRTYFACAVAITLLICALIVAMSRPLDVHRWLARASVILAVVVSAAAVTAAALPDRPAMANPATLDARQATAAALAALVADYRPEAGVWDSAPGEPGWWQSAVDLDDLVAAERALGTHAEDGVIAQTYAVTQDTYAGKIIRWRGPYFDDAGWWGVLWLDAYQWTHDRRYLVAAQGVADWLERGRTGSCGGGVEWGDPSDISHGDQKNSITNTLVVTLDAGLYQVTHRPVDLSRALASWRWLRGSGLVQPGQLVADHLDDHCRPGGIHWSYTQGMTIRGALALTAATGDSDYRATAASIADAATTSRQLNPHGGVLVEPCGIHDINCPEFAGSYVLALAELGGHGSYLARQADSAWRHDRMVGDRYGLEWGGPPDMTSPGRQASAVALLAAVMTDPGQPRPVR